MTGIRLARSDLARSVFFVGLAAVLLAAGGQPADAANVSVAPVAATLSTPSATSSLLRQLRLLNSSVGTPAEPYTDRDASPLGVHVWAYTVRTLRQHPHACMAGVLVPGDLMRHRVTWAQLARTCAWVGPAESVLDRLSTKLRHHKGAGAPINVAIYVPEWTDYGDYGQPGSGVSITETTELQAYLAHAVELAEEMDVAVAYGPSTALVASEWHWGQSYVLDGELITALAGQLRPGDLWMIRPMQMQFMFAPGADFAEAINEYIGYIRAGNPDVAIWVHLALQNTRGAGDEFLAYRESLMDLDVAGTYMGVASGTTPRLHPGTLREMNVVLRATAPD